MKRIREWFNELTRDERGATSVKPVIAIMGALFLCITMMISAFSKHTIDPSSVLVDAVTIITAIGMGADSLDKFSFKGKSIKNTKPESTTTSKSDPEV